MEYAALAEYYDRLAETESTLGKRDVLADLFLDAGPLLPVVVKLVRGRLFAAHQREELGVSSSLTLAAICRATGVDEEVVREQWKETGDLGDAAAWAVANRTQRSLVSSDLTVERVHDTLREVATFEGEGSQERRVGTIAGLLSDAEPDEARYVVRTALGHLRVGVGEGTIRDAIATAFLDGSQADVDAVERAYQVTNDYRVVAETARDEGRSGLAALDVELFRPVQVMLAEKGESLAGSLASARAEGRALCEIKYDGVRVQIHKQGDEIRLFTRRLEDVTEQFPDAVAAVRAGVDAETVILDGELVGYTPASLDTGERSPVPFQQLSQRIKREEDVETMAREVPVVVHLFDCLYDGESLIERPLATRVERLDSAVRVVTAAPADLQAGLERARHVWVEPGPAADAADDAASVPPEVTELYQDALDGGHEGLMIKNPAADYQPGTRVGRMLKVKPTMEPLDLAVTRAMYSEGRRSDWLGRLYLACTDGDDLREVGRLSTGYTDEELAALTERLEELIVSREGRSVELHPDVVLEVEYEEIQRSEEYGSGYALRFPRFLRVREDLDVGDADPLDRIEQLYEAQ